ncbi:hypothetical protein FJY71_05755 [candidate division WOR-3 bacterium]|nr:hypothetical protein [candidate division WOR-3 bacterium]
MSTRWLTVAAGVLGVAACEEPEGYRNRPPTVVITSGPVQVFPDDTVRLTWTGSDADGTVTGYLFGLDDSTPQSATESTGVTLAGLAPGRRAFYVRAVDDSGAMSAAAVHPFRVRSLTGVERRGSDTTFEVATWNVQNFPRAGDSTATLVGELMLALDLDVYALQEVEDTLAFLEMLAGLPGYAGLFSDDDYGSFYQKTAVVYKTGAVAVSGVHQLFWGNDSFPRPPLVMRVAATALGRTFDFQLMVMHLKAGMEASDRALRAGACRALKEYFDSELARGGDSDYVAVGDWNDELDDPPGENVFLPLLADSARYRFLTLPMAGNEELASYIPSAALLDHVMVTAGALPEYGTGYTVTLRVDDELPGYEDWVSDHRPVMAVFPVFR